MASKALGKKKFAKLLKPLDRELATMARWICETGQRMVVLFEGRDTAGKGGAIASIAHDLNPRQCRIAALPAPDERERTQWYFQRYVAHLPAKGEIVLFDRSWYNRAGVERVMDLCTRDQTAEFLRAVPEFERQLVDDGVMLFKYWLCCDQDEQEKRLAKRLDSPTKRWKLSPVDVAAREHYRDYTDAREAMLTATHKDFAPWTLVDFNDQRRGRLTLLRDLLDRVPDTDLAPAEIAWPPLDHKPLKERYGVIQPIADFPLKD
ncbi:MAG: polyphosphate kinase 2 [Sphingomicrobium sp.]